MSVLDRIVVNIIDEAFPLAVPDLSRLVVLGTTSGKSSTVQDEYRSYSGLTDVAGDYDTSDPEYKCFQVAFAQTPHTPTMHGYNITRFNYRKATGTTGTAASDNLINWTSAKYGPLGDNVQVEIKDPGQVGASLDIDTETTLVTGTEAANTAILWTSQKDEKHIIKVEYKDPGTQNASLSVTVTTTDLKMYGHDGSQEHIISFSLATDATSTITTTAADIISLATSDSNVAALVTAANYGASNGSGVVSAMTETAIPFKVIVNCATDDVYGNITSTASEVVNGVNSDTTAATFVSASLGSGTTGAGVVTEETENLDRNNTTASPAELSRALNAMWDLIERQNLPAPYFLVCTSHDEVSGDRQELSNAVASRLMYYLTANKNTETASELKTLASNMASDRTLILAHSSADDLYPEAALAALWGAFHPGNFTTMYKKLNTISAADYSSSDQVTMEGTAPGSSALFTYLEAFGSPVTTGSWSTDGSFADWRRDKDWLWLHLKARIFFLLRNTPKVLGDARGIARLKAAVEEVLDQAVEMGIIAKDQYGNSLYKLEFPDIYTWATLDKAKRHYRIAKVFIHPGGGIEQVTLDVYATYETLVFTGAFGF
jgi:hypothetical protein